MQSTSKGETGKDALDGESPSASAPGEAETERISGDAGAVAAELRLIVLCNGVATTHALPLSGTVALGRSKDVDVMVDDPSVSRRHVLLHVGHGLQVEDLGSANGTRVRGRRLQPGERVEATAGDFVEIGSSVLLIRGRSGSAWKAFAGTASGAEPMDRLQGLLEKVAPSTLSVLLLGETGVGKGHLAQRIHRLSPRAGQAFVEINCAALPESLLESELFGYEKGAFTGANQAKPGLLEAADGGTLLLDEVGEIPLPVQAKLLRVLEQREVLRLGALKPRVVDVRVLSATNRDLEAEVARRTFRADLFFRLEGISLHVPPLRERLEEIEELARGFIGAACQRENRPLVQLSPDALALLKEYPWPGNVRELRNTVERAVLLCSGPRIEPEHLPLEKMKRARSAEPAAEPSGPAVGERERILEALERCAGNQSRAAQFLGVSRRTLISRLDAYGIRRPRKNAAGASGQGDPRSRR